MDPKIGSVFQWKNSAQDYISLYMQPSCFTTVLNITVAIAVIIIALYIFFGPPN